jgi:hypothetical protein
VDDTYDFGLSITTSFNVPNLKVITAFNKNAINNKPKSLLIALMENSILLPFLGYDRY